MSGADLLKRLMPARQDLIDTPGLHNVSIDFDVDEIDLLIEALQRPEVRHSCASTSNYPVMAERALRLIGYNRINHPDAIEMVTHLVDSAGLDNARKAVEDDDDVPF